MTYVGDTVSPTLKGTTVFLALLEIRAARGRFLLMGSVVMLVAALVGIVSGFTTGLGNDTVSALRALPASHVSFSSDAESDQFDRSLVDRKAVGSWQQEDGVEEAAPLGVSITRGTTDRGVDVDLAAFGLEPGSFLAPESTDGRPVGTSQNGVVVSQQLVDEGVRIGDTITIDRLGVELPVDGVAGPDSYGHVPAAYVPLETWQQVRFTTPGTDPDSRPVDQFSGVALKASDGEDADFAAADERHGARTLPREKVLEAAPGYSGERVTMTSIQVFLFLIAPLVVGAFFAVWTVQRGPELALLRAMGASRAKLLSHSVLQAATVVVCGTAAGGLVALGVGALVGGAVPFSLPASSLGTTLLAVAVVGLAGTALTLRRVTAPDPLTMLGANR